MILASADDTERVGHALARAIAPGDVIALFGDLGAGKTTLTRGLLRGLGFDGDVASPTFPIVLPYQELRVPLWHVDLYRIEEDSELDELALEDARADLALVIEWPQRLGSRLWPDALQLSLEIGDGTARSLTAKVPAAWEGRWPFR